MTPKEKAKELVDKLYAYSIGVGTDNAKQCALICVDNMIYEHNLHLSKFGRERIIFLKEVKQEIQLLKQ